MLQVCAGSKRVLYLEIKELMLQINLKLERNTGKVRVDRDRENKKEE